MEVCYIIVYDVCLEQMYKTASTLAQASYVLFSVFYVEYLMVLGVYFLLLVYVELFFGFFGVE